MAMKLQCRCGQKLSVPESAVGKRGKRAQCGATFVIPALKAAASAAAPTPAKPTSHDGLGDLAADLPDLPDLRTGLMGPDDDFAGLRDEALDTPALPRAERNLAPAKPASSPTKKRVDTRAQFTKVANGIKLVFWGTLLFVAIALLDGFGVLSVANLAAAGVMLFGGLLSTVGRLMCLSVPDQVKGKWLIYVAVACDLASVGTRIAGTVTTVPLVVGALAGVLSLGTLPFFVLFLKAIAIYIKEEHLVDDANVIFVAVAIAIVSILAPLFVVVFPPMVLLILPIALVGSAAMLYAVYKYLNLLQHTAECVRP